MASIEFSDLFDLSPIPSMLLSPSHQIHRVSQSLRSAWQLSETGFSDQRLMSFLRDEMSFVNLGVLDHALHEATTARSVRNAQVSRTQGHSSISTRIVPIFKDDELLWLILEWIEAVEDSQAAKQKQIDLQKPNPEDGRPMTRYPGLDGRAKNELRSSMNGILGMCSMLLDTPLTNDQQLFVQTTRQSANAISEALGLHKFILSGVPSTQNGFHYHPPEPQTTYSMSRTPPAGLSLQEGPPLPPPRRQPAPLQVSSLAEGLKDLAQGKKLLVAEDNKINQRIMFKFLQKLAFDEVDIDLASNGEEAVTKVCANPSAYALLFMDISMPVMDGFEATERIRARGITVTIVAMSASALKRDLEQCIRMGMDHVICKPLMLTEIADVLRKWLPTVRSRATTPVVVRSVL